MTQQDNDKRAQESPKVRAIQAALRDRLNGHGGYYTGEVAGTYARMSAFLNRELRSE